LPSLCWGVWGLRGKEEGFEQGREEGEAQGRREEKKAIAASLLESGLLDAEKIATMTGLTMEEVKGLQVE
ncbi:MAG: hypothetical protein D3920_07730, partial [Candidatus Electrothrix sp. AW2]|nr:hypothetical protein [Candidatus Electrothrix gigas]